MIPPGLVGGVYTETGARSNHVLNMKGAVDTRPKGEREGQRNKEPLNRYRNKVIPESNPGKTRSATLVPGPSTLLDCRVVGQLSQTCNSFACLQATVVVLGL